MTRTRGERYRTTMSLALAFAGVIGIAGIFSVRDSNGQVKGDPKPSPSKSGRDARKIEWTTDIDDAIQTVEKDDFKIFFERYAPVEVLRQLRQQDLLDRAATVLAGKPQAKAQLLAILKAIRKQTPAFDKSRGLATIQFDAFKDGVEEISGELHLPVTEGIELTGLGGNLNKVLADASELLMKEDTRTFIEKLLPASELARLQEPAAMQDLLQQFKSLAAVPAGQDAPNVMQQLKADFIRMRQLTPQMTEEGKVAVFRIEPPINQPLNPQQVRIIKFQKVGDNWRFFDDAARVATELTRQAKLKPPSTTTTIQMELIGGNWRFIELPTLGFGRQ